jgi:hypothetical protein
MSFVQGSTALEGDTTLLVTARNGTLMILQNGPLDGEQQIVASLPNTGGSTMFFNLPHYQFFDAHTGNVVGRGLEVTYTYARPGPPPDTNDTWVNSEVFTYTGETAFLPVPGGLYPTVSVLEPNTGPAGSSTIFTMTGAGFKTITGIYMPLTSEANNVRPVASFHVIDDGSATVHSISAAAGLYDLSLAYAGGYMRYASAFRFV